MVDDQQRLGFLPDAADGNIGVAVEAQVGLEDGGGHGGTLAKAARKASQNAADTCAAAA
ncbi:MAG: hypothetical protein WDN06_05865 [Asticcacaulis sp.]